MSGVRSFEQATECWEKFKNEVVKPAYRKLAHRYHPDKPTGHAEKFRAVQEAYEVLTKHISVRRPPPPRPRYVYVRFGSGMGSSSTSTSTNYYF
jgi:DnaJ-class molecular chaperone